MGAGVDGDLLLLENISSVIFLLGEYVYYRSYMFGAVIIKVAQVVYVCKVLMGQNDSSYDRHALLAHGEKMLPCFFGYKTVFSLPKQSLKFRSNL